MLWKVPNKALSLPPSLTPTPLPRLHPGPVLPYSRSHRSEMPRSIFPGKRFRSTPSESHTPPPHTGFPMSAHLSRLRLFQRHLRSLVWVWAWVWDWVHTSPRTLLPRSPSSRHPFPRVHWCMVVSLVHTSLGSSYLIAHVLHYPHPPTRTTLY
jgi:hypothetical protein